MKFKINIDMITKNNKPQPKLINHKQKLVNENFRLDHYLKKSVGHNIGLASIIK